MLGAGETVRQTRPTWDGEETLEKGRPTRGDPRLMEMAGREEGIGKRGGWFQIPILCGCAATASADEP